MPACNPMPPTLQPYVSPAARSRSAPTSTPCNPMPPTLQSYVSPAAHPATVCIFYISRRQVAQRADVNIPLLLHQPELAGGEGGEGGAGGEGGDGGEGGLLRVRTSSLGLALA